MELLAEVPVAPAPGAPLRKQLGEQVPPWFPSSTTVLEQFRKLLKSNLPLGALCDIFAFALPLELEFKQALLEELEVEQRLRKLVERMEHAEATRCTEAEGPHLPASV